MDKDRVHKWVLQIFDVIDGKKTAAETCLDMNSFERGQLALNLEKIR